MARAPRVLLKSFPPGLPLPLKVVLKLGVTSDELLPVLFLVAQQPEKLKVGLMEELPFKERWLLLTSILATPLVAVQAMAATASAPSSVAPLVALCVLLIPWLVLLLAYPWRMRAVIVRRAIHISRGRGGAHDDVGASMGAFLEEAVQPAVTRPR